ncbi:OmpA family protein [Paracoccaceae bacterium GXU_MW_L88]
MAGSAALAWYGADWAMDELETRTEDELSTALSRGYPWASVSADGLMVRLTGEAPSEADRMNARELLNQHISAARVDDGVTVAPKVEIPEPDFVLEILRQNGRLSLIGLVPQEAGRELLMARLDDIDGTDITDMLESVDYQPPEGWTGAVDLATRAAAILPRSRISATPDEVTITATLDSNEDRAAVEEQLYALEQSGVTLNLSLSTPPAVVAPFTLSVVKDADGLEIETCHAATSDEAAQIRSALKLAGDEGQICTIALGSPDPNWGSVAEAAIGALAKLEAGRLDMRDLEVKLAGVQGGDRTAFDEISKTLAKTLPEPFDLSLTRPAPVELDVENGPKITLTRAANGDVTMKGPIRDDLSAEAVEGFAASVFGAVPIHTSFTPTDGLPEGWNKRIFAASEALSLAKTGTAELTNDHITIVARDTDSTVAPLMDAFLRDAFGPENYTLDAAVDPELYRVFGSPEADECSFQIKALLDLDPLQFEVAEARLAPQSEPTVGQIAEILKTCPYGRFEVAGYTDNQGDAEYNRELSQSRAEAVREGLLLRGVELMELQARGYGQDDPIADNETEEGRAQNRRIEIRQMEADNG